MTLWFELQNTKEENDELIAELDPDENGFVDWIQWVTQLISVSVLTLCKGKGLVTSGDVILMGQVLTHACTLGEGLHGQLCIMSS